MQYRRNLPHWIPEGAALSLTWRLANSLGEVSPTWLSDSRLAQMVVDALHFGAEDRGFYKLFAYVVMPNHVHVLLQPHIELPTVMRWLKGRTTRVANRILGRTREPLWQDESYDHWVRSDDEFAHTVHYVENNPVRAGFVEFAEQWRWSSASDRPRKTMACSTSREAHGY